MMSVKIILERNCHSCQSMKISVSSCLQPKNQSKFINSFKIYLYKNDQLYLLVFNNFRIKLGT